MIVDNENIDKNNNNDDDEEDGDDGVNKNHIDIDDIYTRPTSILPLKIVTHLIDSWSYHELEYGASKTIKREWVALLFAFKIIQLSQVWCHL